MSENECRSYLQLCHHLVKAQSRDSFQMTWKSMAYLGARSDLQDVLATHLGLVERFTLGGHADTMLRTYSNGQIESKLWLVNSLRHVLPRQPYRILIVGGWTGLLANLLMWMAPEWVDTILQVDMDAEAQWMAKSFHEQDRLAGKFHQVVQDIYDFDGIDDYHLIINCSCEHFASPDWLRRVTRARFVALQSNDFRTEPTHVDCVNDLTEFKDLYPFSMTLFQGTYDLGQYRRFMRIGRLPYKSKA